MGLRAMIAAFGSIDGQLAVGGLPLERLTARVGSTPYFAYDRRLLSERIGLLRAVLPPVLQLSYAVKANPMPAVVQHLAGLVDGLDVASRVRCRPHWTPKCLRAGSVSPGRARPRPRLCRPWRPG